MTTPLSDRERILLHIIRCLYSGSLISRHGATFGASDKRDLKPGDLVLGVTASLRAYHPWSVSEIVEPLRGALGGFLVRDIVTGETCEYSNEMFVRIDGLDRSDDVFLCGDQRALYEKVLAAFRRSGNDEYRYGGLVFDGPRTARIVVRCKFGGWRAQEEAIPFELPITFNKRTSIAAILRAMIAGGFGTREWTYQPRASS